MLRLLHLLGPTVRKGPLSRLVYMNQETKNTINTVLIAETIDGDFALACGSLEAYFMAMLKLADIKRSKALIEKCFGPK